MERITRCLDEYMETMGLDSLDPVTANRILEKAGILNDTKVRPGKPLRDLLRKELLPHSYQVGGKGSKWVIPHSKYTQNSPQDTKQTNIHENEISLKTVREESYKESNNTQILERLEKARMKYKPDIVKYLLIAEAPPDSIERFFYYEDVTEHDYLFLRVIGVLYPDIKSEYLGSRRNSKVKRRALMKFMVPVSK